VSQATDKIDRLIEKPYVHSHVQPAKSKKEDKAMAIDAMPTKESVLSSLYLTLKQVEEKVTMVLGAAVTLERKLIMPVPDDRARPEEPPRPDAILPLTQYILHRMLGVANETYDILERLERELSC